MGESKLILLAEDDDDDYFLTREALIEAGLSQHRLERVRNGEELMARLHDGERPSILLLDLNMPRKDGREALAELKADPALRALPVIVVTTSRSQEDLRRCYDLGASAYMRKPSGFDDLVEMIGAMGRYWLELVDLPDAVW